MDQKRKSILSLALLVMILAFIQIFQSVQNKNRAIITQEVKQELIDLKENSNELLESIILTLKSTDIADSIVENYQFELESIVKKIDSGQNNLDSVTREEISTLIDQIHKRLFNLLQEALKELNKKVISYQTKLKQLKRVVAQYEQRERQTNLRDRELIKKYAALEKAYQDFSYKYSSEIEEKEIALQKALIIKDSLLEVNLKTAEQLVESLSVNEDNKRLIFDMRQKISRNKKQIQSLNETLDDLAKESMKIFGGYEVNEQGFKYMLLSDSGLSMNKAPNVIRVDFIVSPLLVHGFTDLLIDFQLLDENLSPIDGFSPKTVILKDFRGKIEFFISGKDWKALKRVGTVNIRLQYRGEDLLIESFHLRK